MENDTIDAIAQDAAKLSTLMGVEQAVQYQIAVHTPVMMTAVDSSNLRALGWAEVLGLVVEFKNGGIYSYPSLPEATLDAILTAESKGKAFHSEVKAKEVAFHKLQ